MTVEDSSGFGYWFAGFVDGEGSFNIARNSRGARYCVFRIALSKRDLSILKEIQSRFGFGTLWIGHPASQYSARVAWTVQSKSECLRLVEIFERFPLRTEKRRDFEIWARAVRAHQSVSRGNKYNKHDWTAIDNLRNELCSGRPQRGFPIWQPQR